MQHHSLSFVKLRLSVRTLRIAFGVALLAAQTGCAVDGAVDDSADLQAESSPELNSSEGELSSKGLPPASGTGAAKTAAAAPSTTAKGTTPSTPSAPKTAALPTTSTAAKGTAPSAPGAPKTAADTTPKGTPPADPSAPKTAADTTPKGTPPADPSAPKTAADDTSTPALTAEQLQAIANALQGIDILSQLGFVF
jgi:hypothetical protein